MLRNYREHQRLKIALNPLPLNFTSFLTNQQTNQQIRQCGATIVVPVECLVPYSYVFGTRSTRLPRGSRHHRTTPPPKKHTQARKRQSTALARPATHCLSVCLVIIFSPSRGKKQANHVLPQPCRRRRALRFLGQCLHVSFRDTASTDAIYLCACLEGASRPV